jgi:hypothetical protein
VLGLAVLSLPLPPIAPVRTSAKAIAPASTPAPAKSLSHCDRLMFAPQLPVSRSPTVERQSLVPSSLAAASFAPPPGRVPSPT